MDWKYESGRIYSVDENNNLLAETNFSIKEGGEVDISHTYVDPSLRGKGVAGKMMEAVTQYLRENGLKATAAAHMPMHGLKRTGNRTPTLYRRISMIIILRAELTENAERGKPATKDRGPAFLLMRHLYCLPHRNSLGQPSHPHPQPRAFPFLFLFIQYTKYNINAVRSRALITIAAKLSTMKSIMTDQPP